MNDEDFQNDSMQLTEDQSPYTPTDQDEFDADLAYLYSLADALFEHASGERFTPPPWKWIDDRSILFD